MAIKNLKLGGVDFLTPSDRVKPTDLNDTFDAAADIILFAGNPIAQFAYEQVKAASSSWTNTDYLGADIFTDSNGAKNTVDTGNSTSEFNTSYYELRDLSNVLYYAIVEATSGPSNSSSIYNFTSGKWLIYDENNATNDAETQRAIVHKKLWSDALMDGDFTGITALKLSDSDDVGYRGYKVTFTGSSGGSLDNDGIAGDFDVTTGNVVSSWSNLGANRYSPGSSGSYTTIWQVPSGTTLNSITDSAYGANSMVYSNEIGTDLSGDEKTNPANFRINCGTHEGSGTATVIFFTKGGITITFTDYNTYSLVDYYTDHSVPETTLADTLANESITDGDYASSGTVETNTIINEKVPNSIVVYGKADLPTNTSITVDVSDDGGSTFGLTDKSLNTSIDTSTFTTGDLALKFNLNTTDTSATPKLYGYGVAITS